jgi:CrcB protein
LDKYFAVLAGAGLGGLFRYLAALWLSQRFPGPFPAGTFVVNLTGSFLIGLLMTLLSERFPAFPNLRLFLIVGVLGGYTTFSSFEYEIFQAMRGGERWIGLLYGLGSIICGYFAVWLGTLLAARR